MKAVFQTLAWCAVWAAFSTISSAATATVSPEETALSLNGTWRIQPAGAAEREIVVPGFWERSPGLADVHEATCRREFEVPESFAGQRALLRFDAVGDAAEVSVNGQHAGGHVGPCLPFEADITGLVAVPSTTNQLAVFVRDDTHFSVPRDGRGRRNRRSWIPRGMGANNRKGLYQGVTLLARPVVNIADARIRTSVRQKELSVTWELFNGRKETVHARLSSQVSGQDGAVVFTLPATNLDLPGFVTTKVSLTAPFKNVELWQPDHPTLYTLQTALTDGSSGALLHRKSTRFGFRETWFEGIHFCLNGIRCNLRGESPAYAEKTDLFATREAATEMLRHYQAANCNVLRFHSMPAPPHVLEVCDELGMMVIDESAIYASWQMLMPEHPDWMEHCREHLTRWVRRDRNHPSVILWSAENEGLNVSALTAAMLAEFRRIIDAADYRQPVPLGCGEFMFPYEPGLRQHERQVIYSMGLQARGYRLADWFDIRPYNPSYSGFLRKEGVRPDCREAYGIMVKSFAPIAVFDKDYDELGPFPQPPKLRAGAPVTRTLIVYNDAFSGEEVELHWRAMLEGKLIAGERRALNIPLGGHTTVEITFTPPSGGELRLELVSVKGGTEQFQDSRPFTVE